MGSIKLGFGLYADDMATVYLLKHRRDYRRVLIS